MAFQFQSGYGKNWVWKNPVDFLRVHKKSRFLPNSINFLTCCCAISPTHCHSHGPTSPLPRYHLITSISLEAVITDFACPRWTLRAVLSISVHFSVVSCTHPKSKLTQQKHRCGRAMRENWETWGNWEKFKKSLSFPWKFDVYEIFRMVFLRLYWSEKSSQLFSRCLLSVAIFRSNFSHAHFFCFFFTINSLRTFVLFIVSVSGRSEKFKFKKKKFVNDNKKNCRLTF